MTDEIESLLKYEKTTGGPAFPSEHKLGDGGVFFHPGLSIRDWFAGQALAGMAGDPDLTDDWEMIATKAYYAADEMLKKRNE